MLSLIFPKKCFSCAEYIDPISDFCGACWNKISFVNYPWCKICGTKFEYNIQDNFICGGCVQNNPKFDIARHIFAYNEYSKKMIHDFKFNDRTFLADIFSKMLFNKYRNEITEYDLIIPVPMHPIKRIFRLYNQASLLGLYLSKRSKIPMKAMIQKIKWTKAQSALKAKDRKSNLQNSMQIFGDVQQKNIILIDDVYTTGATLNYCSQLLKKAGAKKIFALTLSKTYKN